jgi:hypothetical protein
VKVVKSAGKNLGNWTIKAIWGARKIGASSEGDLSGSRLAVKMARKMGASCWMG